MAISENVGANLPCLRRYARALTGSQISGDYFVRATLEAALADKELLAEIGRGRVELYAAFSRLWSASRVDVPVDASGSEFHEQAAQARLAAITPDNRQALLLTTLEDFTFAETAAILRRDASDIEEMVAQAMTDISAESKTEVLIIEDEPLIAMQLEDLVEDLGHNVVGTVATRSQAAAIFGENRPGLVLADVQLADGSSGIDTVDDILEYGDIPVVFITAFPEKLLTGERSEPTYLISKPFQEQAVRTAISQALFFGSSRPLTS